MQPSEVITIAANLSSLSQTGTVSNISAAQTQVVGTAILTGPAGPGVPTGGTAGQVLSKIDGTSYNTQWVNAGGSGSGIQLGPTQNRSADFTAVTNTRYFVDTTASNVTSTLPVTANKGDLLFIQKNGAANILYYSGKINGTTTSTFPIRTDLQAKLLEFDGVDSWNTIAGDLSLTSLDARYPQNTSTPGGDVAGAGSTYASPLLNAVGSAGTYGSSTAIPIITTDSKGRVTGVSTATPATQTATGTAGGDLTGTYPNPTLVTTGTSGTKGSASAVPVFVTDTKGRVTSNTDTPISIAESQVINLVNDLTAKDPYLADTTLATAGALTAGVMTQATGTGTYTAPTPAGSVTNPPQRFGITNRTAGTITLSFPNPAGTTINLTMLSGEVTTFRQVTTSGYVNESGNKPLAQLDARYLQNITGLVTQGSNVTITGSGTSASPYNISAAGGSNSTTNNFNNDQIDQTGGGTSTYGALAGLVNGTNTVFTVSNGSYPSGKLKVFKNGQMMTLGSTGDYTETAPGSGTFTFNTAPTSGTIVTAAYPTVTTSSNSINQTMFTATSSNPVTGNTTEKSALPTSGVGSLTIPANNMIVGRTYYLKTFGTYQTPATPGGVTVKIKLGSVTIATAVVASSLLAGSSNYNELYGDACITVRSTGTTGTVTCSGFLTFQIATGTTTVPFSSSADNTSYTSPTKTVDTTIANLVDVTETWTTSTAGQGTSVDQCVLERKN